MLVALVILAACSSSDLSINELESVPEKVRGAINSESTLQMITSEKDTYIVFHSTDAASVKLEVTDKILNINFTTSVDENNELKQYVYKLNEGDSDHDTINVSINEEDTYFDGGVTIL